MLRWFLFLIAIAIGAVLGGVYGWVIRPVERGGLPPAALREDYRADYALMVAEAYQRDGDLALAARRLAFLDEVPQETVRQALAFAGTAPYAETDQALLRNLAMDLSTFDPTPGAPAP
jgi:hypothetical protein